MCRSIKKLRLAEGSATREEIEASALQFVRKVSGYRKPSRVNTEPYEAAIREISDSTEKLLASLTSSAGRPAC